MHVTHFTCKWRMMPIHENPVQYSEINLLKTILDYTLLTLKYGVNLLNAPIIKHITSKVVRDILSAACSVYTRFSHCVNLTSVLLPQIISYSDAKVSGLVVMKCKRTSVIYVYELTFLLHTSRSTEYRPALDSLKEWWFWSLHCSWIVTSSSFNSTNKNYTTGITDKCCFHNLPGILVLSSESLTNQWQKNIYIWDI